MTTTPIASQLAEEQLLGDNINGSDPAQNLTAPKDFMVDLLDAQQDLITAQHQFLHGSDTSALLAAQNRFIMAQMDVLRRLGVYGPG